MKKVRWIFINNRGELRLGWRLTVGILTYALAFYGVLWGLSAVFGTLFEAWNLTNENLVYAPKWAQTIVLWHTDFTYALAYTVSMLAAILLAKRWTVGKKSIPQKAGFAALMGISLGAALTLIAFAFDSMRLENPLSEPSLSAYHVSALAVLVLGSFSGEAMSKRLVFDPIRERFGRAWGYVAVGILSLILSGRWTDPLGMLNALLLAIVGCATYEHGGILASAVLSAGWSAWTTWLFAWPGSSSISVFQMYTVSDAWLTGGNAGANGGFGATIGWIIIAAILLRKELKNGFAGRKKERNTNGKDSHCDRRSRIKR